MKKRYLTLFGLFLITMGYSQESNKDYTETFNLVEVWLEAQKDYEQLPGLAAIVVEDQEVLWSGAFGLANVEKNIKAETSTLCSICSISKLFTSVAIMRLYDEGKLRLDDRVRDLLPSYDLEQKFPESGPITVRTLLTHSSGLPREAGYPYWTGPDFPFPTREQIDAKLKEQETLYPSSTYFQYSNLGLTLLGEIVEQVSGIPFDEYIQVYILEPLALVNTRTELPESLYGSALAIGYSAVTREGKREKVKFFQAGGIAPAAGFSSNVEDLGKFASWQFRLRDTTVTEILTPSTMKYMHNVHWTNPDWKNTWGLGFNVYEGEDGNTWVGHGGSCPGYRSTLQLDLNNKRAFSIMINASGTNPNKYVRGINGIINHVEFPKKENQTKDTTKKKNLKEYIGYYSQKPWWGETYISTWGDKLVSLSLPSEKPGESMTFYKHIDHDTFRRIRDNDELGETLIFERDKHGQIIRFKRHENYSNIQKRPNNRLGDQPTGRIGMKISLTSVFVDDPVKAHKFYTEVLGFQTKTFDPDAQLAVVVSPEDPNGTALLLEPRGDSFAKTYQENVYKAGLPIIVFSADNVESLRRDLESRGVKFRDDLAKPQWGMKNLFEDTFGNLIMLQEQNVN